MRSPKVLWDAFDIKVIIIAVVLGSDPMLISNEQNIDQICNHVAKESYESPTMVKEKNNIKLTSKIELGSNGVEYFNIRIKSR